MPNFLTHPSIVHTSRNYPIRIFLTSFIILNIAKVLIDELFHPTLSPKPRIFTTSPRTSTESLPIKEHDIGLVDSPTDLIMSNHIAEPVFEDLRRKSRNFGSTTPAPVYLTETQYYLDKENISFYI